MHRNQMQTGQMLQKDHPRDIVSGLPAGNEAHLIFMYSILNNRVQPTSYYFDQYVNDYIT